MTTSNDRAIEDLRSELAKWHKIANEFARERNHAEDRAADLRDVIEGMFQWNKLTEIEIANLRMLHEAYEKEGHGQ